MITRAALFTALSLAILPPLAAGPLHAEDRGYRQPLPAATDPVTTGALPAAPSPAPDVPNVVLIDPGHRAAGDIVDAQGPNPYARELTDIAIYASVGNKDGVAMLSGELRARGVSSETIRSAINRINVHGEAFTAPATGHVRTSPHAEAEW